MRAAALVGLLLVSLAHTASAEEVTPMTEARAHVASGQGHFDVGEYALAIRDFHDAYTLVPRPGFLYNLGQAYRLAGDCVVATTMYRDYLDAAPRSKMRSTVEDHLASMDDCVRVRSAPPPGRIGKRAGLVTGGLGLAALAIGAAFADDRPMLATGLITGGVVAVLAGAALYYVGWRAERDAPIGWRF